MSIFHCFYHIIPGKYLKTGNNYITGISQLCSELDTGEPTIKLITDALVRPLSYDLRDGKWFYIYK
jgi:hypothetical protein